MRLILMATLFALGIGLAGSTGASATPNATMIDKLANSTPTVQKAYCRRVSRCWWHHGHRHCETTRRCW
jgi:hypothetical protein